MIVVVAGSGQRVAGSEQQSPHPHHSHLRQLIEIYPKPEQCLTSKARGVIERTIKLERRKKLASRHAELFSEQRCSGVSVGQLDAVRRMIGGMWPELEVDLVVVCLYRRMVQERGGGGGGKEKKVSCGKDHTTNGEWPVSSMNDGQNCNGLKQEPSPIGLSPHQSVSPPRQIWSRQAITFLLQNYILLRSLPLLHKHFTATFPLERTHHHFTAPLLRARLINLLTSAILKLNQFFIIANLPPWMHVTSEAELMAITTRGEYFPVRVELCRFCLDGKVTQGVVRRLSEMLGEYREKYMVGVVRYPWRGGGLEIQMEHSPGEKEGQFDALEDYTFS